MHQNNSNRTSPSHMDGTYDSELNPLLDAAALQASSLVSLRTIFKILVDTLFGSFVLGIFGLAIFREAVYDVVLDIGILDEVWQLTSSRVDEPVGNLICS